MPTVLRVVLALYATLAHSLSLPAITLTPQDALASVAIFATGDLVSQKLERRQQRPAKRPTLAPARRQRPMQRTASAAGLGLVYGGLALPFVYQLAEGLFPGVSPAKVLAKVVVSCSLLSTFGNWFSMMWRRCAQPSPVPGESISQRLSRCCGSVNADMVSVLRDDVKVWPAYDLLTFGVIPISVRPFASVLVATLWATYIAYRAAVPQADSELCMA